MTTMIGPSGARRGTTVKSVHSYIEYISKVKENMKKHPDEDNIKWLFRGQPSSRFALEPSLSRKISGASKISLLGRERNLIETAKFMLPDIFRNEYRPVEQLALLRHHTLPTRLLDVTTNALVALFFACQEGSEENNEDGVVFAFYDTRSSNETLALHNAIADTSKFMRGEKIISLRDFVREMKKEPYAYNISDKKEINEKWLVEQCKSLMIVNAPFHLRRQQAQSGLYILFPNKIEIRNEKAFFVDSIEPIETMLPTVQWYLFIPKECKRKIIEELGWLGIDQGSLFADDPDKLCGQIADNYAKELVASVEN